MNERIYTIAELSGATRWNDELNGNSIDFSPEQFEKFAEFIVRECAQIAKDTQDFYNEHNDGIINTEIWTMIKLSLIHI